MTKRLIVALLGVVVVGAGMAVFAANTAQWVNVQARVEKEIEIACVVRGPTGGPDWVVHPNNCDFGVVFPENLHERNVEVTTSNSFQNNQQYKSAILYWLLWECKQYSDGRDLDGDDVGDCRVDAPTPHGLTYDTSEAKWVHSDEELDDGIRDYINIVPSSAACSSTYTGPTFGVKHIEGIYDGTVTWTAPKCFYDLHFSPPACTGHWNPQTDPGTDPKEVDCEEVTFDRDPQKWDRWADIGDDLKIQVYDFLTEIP
ncbi:MAG: hypothetical protein Q7T33_07100 [Dehalococcoidia bacterium]|nr:hypothetical protein [Dehalococcoidia bacterium]